MGYERTLLCKERENQSNPRGKVSGVREAGGESLFPILIARVLRRSPPSQVLSKAVANNQLKPKKGLNSKINGRLIDSIRLDSARLLGFVLFLIRSSGSLRPCDRVRETKNVLALRLILCI